MEGDNDYASARHGSDLKSSEPRANERTARGETPGPRKVKTQTVPVVFDPRVLGPAGSFRQRDLRRLWREASAS